MIIQKIRNKIFYGRMFFITFIMATAVMLVSFTAEKTDAKPKDVMMVPASFSDLADSVSPAVVNIRTEKTTKTGGFRHFSRRPFGRNNDPFEDFFERFFGNEMPREHKERSLGSGFLVDKDGYIVTNNHVVENADEIKVRLKNGDDFDASVIGRDPKTDLALIKIDNGGNLPFLNLGDSEKLKVGQWVVAIGSPFGLEQTVTAGIVSAKGRVIGSGPYDDFIQTDASINPGNSGGPLLNMDGEVVGINTAIISGGQGIGFAIPANLAKGIIGQLKTTGEVTRGFLGVSIQNISEELAEYYGIKDGKGVIVAEVVPGAPADKAGIEVQDIIIEVNGEKIDDNRRLSAMIAAIEVGKIVEIKALRDGKEKTYKVEIGRMSDDGIASAPKKTDSESDLGMNVAELTPEMARRLNINEKTGVVVTEVKAGTKAEEAGIMHGDIIKEINHKPVNTISEYNEIIDDIDKGDSIQMFIKRSNEGFIVIKLEK